MRCQNCKAYIPYDSKKKECPACGEEIQKKPFFEDLFNMTAEMAADRNFLFWGMVSLAAWVIAGAIEFGLGGGQLFDYFEGNIFHSLVLFLFWGCGVDILAKVNAQIRLASRTLILKERRNLRIFRMGTNLSLIAGLGISLIWIGPEGFFGHFPGVTLLTMITMSIFWAAEGLYFKEDHFEDHRVRNFFILIGVRHPHPYRVAAGWFMFGIVFAAVIYLALTMFPSIFWGIYKSWFIQSSIKAINGFLQYLPI